jgi:hypothetical protein
MMNAGCIGKRPISHDGCFFVAHVQIQTLVRDLFNVDVQSKIIEIILSELERVRFYGAQKFIVLYNRE